MLHVKTTPGDYDKFAENKRYEYSYGSKKDFIMGHSNRFAEGAFSDSIYLGILYYAGKNDRDYIRRPGSDSVIGDKTATV
jgi:hypothetical protein